MSNRCWATGGGMSYHKDRPLINGQLPSYATVRKAAFVRAELKHARCYAALPSNTFVNTVSRNRGARAATLARQSVNTMSRNSESYRVTVLCVVRAEAT
ncbi:hypothetical protein B7P43_G16745 [Cryptotermes secundus]|uniref:Uncharacterized protein n=1 Tax=Cryptotermes secundus TaxID=105785 RepID=A0A2J7QIK0_9NEOP|nr:hypothetical protein B7P43_G16745 [Cryptotermes secundus]